jgi:hypothetical protein
MAQTLITGDVTGTVTDPSGAVIPRATVSLTNNGTGAGQETLTNGQGSYRFSLLAPGSYLLTASAPDFSPAKKNVQVRVGQIAAVNLQLALATALVSIEVHEALPTVQTTNANISSNVVAKQLADVPNPGNDMTFYALLAPGVQLSTSGGNANNGNFSSFGLPATSNTFTINGATNNDTFSNVGNTGASNLMLGSNAIGEAAVVNTGYTGQYGRLAGAQVNYVSKSGTNNYHGNAIYYWNGSAMNANNFFNNLLGEPKAFSNVNMWATSLGGPFPKQKNRTFFFVDYEGTRILLPTNDQALIPTSQFAAATLNNLAATGQSQAIPFYQKIFNLYASAPEARFAVPVRGGGCGTPSPLPRGEPCAQQFRANQGNFTSEDIWSVQVDHNLGANDRMFVQVQRDNGVQATYTDLISPIFNAFSQQPAMNGQFSQNHRFNAAMVNQFILTGQFYSTTFGPPDYNAVLAVFPTVIRFLPTLFSNMGGVGYLWPQGHRATQYQIIDDLSWNLGAHNLKFGMNLHRIDMTDLDFQTFQQGLITELNLKDFYNGGGTNSVLQQKFPQVSELPFAYYTLGVYAQDEWKVNSRLTVTAALRADHNSNPVCQVNCFANLIAPFNSLPHNPNVPYNQVIRTNLHQAFFDTTMVIWQPRVGFAWIPTRSGNTVVRGGFGLFGDIFPGKVAELIAGNPPMVNSFLIRNGNITPGAPGSLFQIAAAANQSFLDGFNSGGTVGSISATNPLFRPPNVTTTDAIYKQARYEEFNLEVQQQLPWNMIASANFVGNHGYNLVISNNGLNGFAPPAFNFVGLPSVKPDTRFQAVTQLMTGAISNYRGMVLSLRRRAPQGLQFGFYYTYSHALDEVSNAGYFPFDTQTAPSIENPQNPYNIRQYNYGNADYDARHYISANYVWDDVFHNTFKKRVPKLLTSGWTISGTVFFRTGQPFTVIDTNASNSLVGNGFLGPIFATPIQPGYNSCGPSAVDTPCPSLSQFAPSTIQPNGFGNQTRNQYRGPWYFDTDMSLMKNFKIPRWEGAKFGVGFQFYNILNHPNFDKPQNDIALGQGTFGTIVNTVSAPTSIFGAFMQADASVRIIQLRAQFVF